MRCSLPRFVLGIAVGLGALGCLRPSEERARRDEQVGSAEADGVRVEVAGGHAAVRELERDRVLLWAGAPRLSLTFAWDAPPPGEVSVEVLNCMPRAEVVPTPSVPVLESGRDASGRCSFRLGPLAGTALELGIAPPDTAAPSPFRFAVMSDVQEAIVDVQDIYSVMNREPDIDFLLGAGDLTEQGTHEQLQRFERELRSLSIPYYTTLGNHELGQSPSLFQDYFGRGSESFEYRGVRFTLLDSASATLDPIVLDWLDEWLAAGADQAHVVAMHIPPLDPIGVRNGAFANRNEAAKLLRRLAAAGVDLTLYGHIHSYYHFENAGMPAHVSGGGGAIPEKFDDIGRHFLVVDADPATQRLDVSVVRVD
ncbi:MAG TPA: metallophosphoesterase [Polyangiaceae bacterium]|nr:metallophosphoesterase [Polyangiaceae bacterium]